MKLGIKKIQCIPSALCADWSYYPAGSVIDIQPFVNGEFLELEGTQNTLAYKERWSDDENGCKSSIAITGSIRRSSVSGKQQLGALLGKGQIVLIFSVEGPVLVVGSKEMPSKITFEESYEGLSLKELPFLISCESTHGALILSE